jgi:guanylate kinase
MSKTTVLRGGAGETSGLLVIVSGPSAVGKDTILDRALSEPETLVRPAVRCVTATTRLPRAGEVDGVAYHFLSAVQFEQKAQEDGFLEYANVFGNWYGTPRDWVVKQQELGNDVILKIDVQGALTVKQKASDAILIFFRPPSLEELERRLRARNTESEEQVARRLLDARNEMAQMPHYDYCVINNEIDQAVLDLRSILRAEHCKVCAGV